MHIDPAELPARYYRAFNERDFDVWRDVFDEAVEHVIDGIPFHGVDTAVGRLPPATEATAYFIVAEALTNVAKHAHAERAEIEVRMQRGVLRVEVRDDGAVGARPDGTGLIGLRERLAAVDGRLLVDSPSKHGTRVIAEFPLDAPETVRTPSA